MKIIIGIFILLSSLSVFSQTTHKYKIGKTYATIDLFYNPDTKNTEGNILWAKGVYTRIEAQEVQGSKTIYYGYDDNRNYQGTLILYDTNTNENGIYISDCKECDGKSYKVTMIK